MYSSSKVSKVIHKKELNQMSSILNIQKGRMLNLVNLRLLFKKDWLEAVSPFQLEILLNLG